jgi:ArsR family transcriptional regulator
MKTAARVDRVDVMFRAFSDRTRLRLLNMLRTGETCVCDLVEVLDVPQPKVSRHLAYLRRAGLVTARKDGFWMHYQLADARTEFHKSLLNCLACCFGSVPELSRDLKRLGRSKNACCTDGSNCCER